MEEGGERGCSRGEGKLTKEESEQIIHLLQAPENIVCTQGNPPSSSFFPSNISLSPHLPVSLPAGPLHPLGGYPPHWIASSPPSLRTTTSSGGGMGGSRGEGEPASGGEWAMQTGRYNLAGQVTPGRSLTGSSTWDSLTWDQRSGLPAKGER